MALNTITQVKLANGKIVDMVDWSDQPLFSSIDLQTGFTTQEMSLFQYVTGDSVPGFAPVQVTTRTATDNETNIATPGAMASTEEMLVYAIKPEIYAYLLTESGDFGTRIYDASEVGASMFPVPNAQAIAVLQQQLLLQLEISQKVFAQAGLGYFNTGFGVFGAGIVTSTPFGNNGVPSQEAVRSFVIPHHIGSQEKYRVQLVNSSNTNGGAVAFGYMFGGDAIVLNPLASITMRVTLDGLYKRPVA